MVSSPLDDFYQGALPKSREDGTMETWDIALMVVAGYVATFGLARLMTRRREQLLEQFRTQMEQQRPARDSEEAEPPKRRAA